ncbi:hypothetical protein PMEGAS67_25220 [Priestia megaterium]
MSNTSARFSRSLSTDKWLAIRSRLLIRHVNWEGSREGGSEMIVKLAEEENEVSYSRILWKYYR